MKACPQCKSSESLGTNELIPGTAMCDVADDGEILYQGWTDVCWDGQETIMEDGEPTMFCKGCAWSGKRSELIPAEVESEV